MQLFRGLLMWSAGQEGDGQERRWSSSGLLGVDADGGRVQPGGIGITLCCLPFQLREVRRSTTIIIVQLFLSIHVLFHFFKFVDSSLKTLNLTQRVELK